MAISYASEVTIDRPPDEVFSYLIEPAKQALWSDVPMKRLTEGDARKGSQYEVTFGMGPMKAIVGLEMTAVESGSLMSWKTFKGPITWEGEYRVEPAGAGSKLSQHGTLTFHGLWRLIQPIAAAEIRNGEIKELEKLKAVAEAAGASS